MPPPPEQNYANHRSVDYALYPLAISIILGAVAGICGAHLMNTELGAILLTLSALLYAVALAGLMLKLRRYAVTVQDRVIRLEMRVRLEQVLPKELCERAKGLTLSQLIGLRYASDAELPDLAEKALADKSLKSDAIKRMVKHWQADHLRV